MAKSAEAFRTISEAADELGVAQHVLRFWETKFSFIKPMKRAGGRRFYRPADIQVLARVRRLLHQEGYTIKGVQKLYRESGLNAPLPEAGSPSVAANGLSAGRVSTGRLAAVIVDLEAAKLRLDQALGQM
ncbi:MAG TPA: MerR family transcriptional regulator [Caulobacteraceae bacterium]|nr:MerR family transcriptional regulator [Caulobacteraceae bacterium]